MEATESPDTLASVPSPPRNRRFISRWLIAGLLGLIVIVVALLYFFDFKSPKSNQHNIYHYAAMDSYSLSYKGSSGKGMSFQKPVEFTQANTSIPNIAVLSNRLNQKPATVVVAVSPIAEVLTSNNLAGIDTVLSSRSGTSYQTMLSGYKNTIVSWFSSKPRQVTIGTVTNLQNHRWEINYQATGQNGSSYQGALLEAASSKGYYYLLIVTSNADWQANQSIWNRVITSVKIDQ